MESEETELELIFEGPEDDSDETLRKIKGAFIADLELGVSEVQEILNSAPLTIKKSSSEDALRVYYKALKNAGARVLLVKEGQEIDTSTTREKFSAKKGGVDNDVVLEFELNLQDEVEDPFDSQPKKTPKIYCIEETSLSELEESAEFMDEPVEVCQSSRAEKSERIPSGITKEKEAQDVSSEIKTTGDLPIYEVRDENTIEDTQPDFVQDDAGQSSSGSDLLIELETEEEQKLPDLHTDLEKDTSTTDLTEKAELTLDSAQGFEEANQQEAVTDIELPTSIPLELAQDESTQDESEESVEETQEATELPSTLSFEDDTENETDKALSALEEIKGNASTKTNVVLGDFSLELDEDQEEAPLIEKDNSLLEQILDETENDSFDLSFGDELKSESLPQDELPKSDNPLSLKEEASPEKDEDKTDLEDSQTVEESPLREAFKVEQRRDEIEIPPSDEKTPAEATSKAPLPSRKLAGLVCVSLAALFVLGLGYFQLNKFTPTAVELPVTPAVVSSDKGKTEKVATAPEEVTKNEISAAPSAPVAIQTFPLEFRGETTDNGTSISYHLVFASDRISSANFVLMLPEPLPLTPEQLVRGVKRDPWIRRVEIQDYVASTFNGDNFSTRGPARVYLEHGTDRKRFIADAEISGTVSADNNLELVISVVHGSNKALANSGYTIQQVASGLYEMSIRAEVSHDKSALEN